MVSRPFLIASKSPKHVQVGLKIFQKTYGRFKSYFGKIKTMPRPKKPEEKKKRKISITIDPELLEELKRDAKIKGLSLSEYIEQQLRSKNTISWDIKEFGRFIQAINSYNGYVVDYNLGLTPGFKDFKHLEYSLENKTITVEFWLKNSKGGANKHKVILDFSWCWDCPSPYVNIKLYGWDDKKKEWFEMGERSIFAVDGERIFNTILEIRRDFWLKLKTFREEKKKSQKN